MIDNLDISKISDLHHERKNHRNGRNYSSLKNFELKFEKHHKNILNLDFHKNTKKLEKSDLSHISNSSFNYAKTVENRVEPLEHYITKVKDQMVKYHTETNIDDEDLNNKTLDSLSDLSEHNEREILNQLRNNSTSRLPGLSEESMMKILIRNRGFKNPFESYKILKHNKELYSDINTKFMSRQKQLYDDAIEKINSYTMRFKVKMPKITVTAVMPKHLDLYQAITNKINKDKESLNTIESHKKEKKKGKKSEVPKHIKSVVVNDFSRLYSHYLYAKKNFPEGREQFSWHSNNEIILWGGIGAIKSNFIWELNPSKSYIFLKFSKLGMDKVSVRRTPTPDQIWTYRNCISKKALSVWRENKATPIFSYVRFRNF
jgi:hypothetical protein